MTEIDSAAFEAGVAPCNFTAGRIDSADESDIAHFSDALGRIYITAQAILLSARPQAGHTQPALTLVVEDSADGSSWATVATFDFTASDQQSAAVDSPRAYLRASWAGVVGTWAVDVAVKSIATPASGGGSTPDIAAVLAEGDDAAGGTIVNLGRLVLDLGGASDSGPTLKLVANLDDEDNNLIEGYNEHGQQVLRADAEGIMRAVELQMRFITMTADNGNVTLDVSPPLTQTGDVVTIRSKLGDLALQTDANGNVLSNTPVTLTAGVTVGGNALFSAIGLYGNAAVGQQQLDPATCTPEDIANALIASTLIAPL